MHSRDSRTDSVAMAQLIRMRVLGMWLRPAKARSCQGPRTQQVSGVLRVTFSKQCSSCRVEDSSCRGKEESGNTKAMFPN